MIDTTSFSLLESYRGWKDAAEQAAKSTREIAIQERLRQTRIDQRKEESQKESAASTNGINSSTRDAGIMS